MKVRGYSNWTLAVMKKWRVNDPVQLVDETEPEAVTCTSSEADAVEKETELEA